MHMEVTLQMHNEDVYRFKGKIVAMQIYTHLISINQIQLF